MLDATMSPLQIRDGLLWFLAFLFSTTVHEAAHALAALRGGDPTAYEGGQVSLSPIPHIKREPIGMLVVPLLTALTRGWAIGWASAPFDPRWAERHPRRAALMAAAGPAGNFSLAILAFIALRVGLATGYFVPPAALSLNHLVAAASDGAAATILAQALSVMLMLNALLGTFNLLPLPPLDGASAVVILLPERLADRFRHAMRSPQFSLFGLLIAWRLFPVIADPITDTVVRLLYRS
jgi:Zn-dependent protease